MTDELPTKQMTEREREYARRLLAGDGPSVAYRAVFPEKAAGKPNPAISILAHKLTHKKGVQQFLKSATAAGLARALPSIEEHAAQLARLRELAVESGQIAAGVSAEFRRGQVAGHYAGKGDDAGRGPDRESLAAALAAIGLGALAERLNKLPGDDAKLIEQEQ